MHLMLLKIHYYTRKQYISLVFNSDLVNSQGFSLFNDSIVPCKEQNISGGNCGWIVVQGGLVMWWDLCLFCSVGIQAFTARVFRMRINWINRSKLEKEARTSNILQHLIIIYIRIASLLFQFNSEQHFVTVTERNKSNFPWLLHKKKIFGSIKTGTFILAPVFGWCKPS